MNIVMTKDGYEPYFLATPISINNVEIDRSEFVEHFNMEEFESAEDVIEDFESNFAKTGDGDDESLEITSCDEYGTVLNDEFYPEGRWITLILIKVPDVLKELID
jgi:hypothetical protein